ncbi:MAG: ribosome biogenesis GTPase Der [Bryobacteraceae bacterium]
METEIDPAAALAQALPKLVIVGRPNVGKSTLFNLLTSSRRAIVGDEPGITRDRIYGHAEYAGRHFDVIDTGGIVPDDDQLIPSEILRQARVALEQADHIVYVIDGRTEITGADRDLSRILQQLGKPVSLAVNKIDAPSRESLAAGFHELGFDVFPISAEHRIGIEEMLDHATATFPKANEEEEEPAKLTRIRVAIIGRPNVGKSTLLNALAGHERSIVTPEAGTTRDAVDETVIHEGVQYIFVDTAGIRRKGKTKLMAEKLSVVMARKHIGMANAVVMLIDGEEGPTGTDATIAGYAHEAGRPVVLAVNKWDAVTDRDKKEWVARVRETFKFLDYAPIAFLSAKNGTGVNQLFGLLRRGWESTNQRVTTGELNRFFEHLQTDLISRVKYVTQSGVRPPTFVVFKEGGQGLHFSVERRMANEIRKRFGFAGAPIVIRTRAGSKKGSIKRVRNRSRD